MHVVEGRVRFQRDPDAGGGLLVAPDASEPVPAVVLMTAIAGVNEYIRRVAALLVQKGYACLVLDFYTREGAVPDLSDGGKIMAAVANLSDPRTLGDIEQAMAYLRRLNNIDGDHISILGFCIGGSYALLAAAKVPGLKSAVAFYGVIRYQQLNETKPVSPINVGSEIRCPLLGHFGEADHLVSIDSVQELKRIVRHGEIYTYPGAGHAFHEDHRPEVYRPVAAHLAWQRTLVHLDWYLRH